jgi:hypothetical protein
MYGGTICEPKWWKENMQLMKSWQQFLEFPHSEALLQNYDSEWTWQHKK